MARLRRLLFIQHLAVVHAAKGSGSLFCFAASESLNLPASSFSMVVTLDTFSRYPPHIPPYIHETENEYSQNPVKCKFLAYTSATYTVKSVYSDTAN
jgi:hypothetical protein